MRIAWPCRWLFFAVALAQAADFQTLYQQGLAAKQAGRHDEAIARLEAAVALEPRNVDALFQLGAVLGWTKRYHRALEILDRALKIAPQNSDLRLAIARVKMWQGDFAVAQREIDFVLAAQPGQIEARLLRARLLVWQKRAADAEAEFRRILAAAPARSDSQREALIGLGDLLAGQERFPEAGQMYRQVEAFDPESPEIRQKLRALNSDGAWRIDTGYSYSTFSRQPRSDWHEGYMQLNHRFDRCWSGHLRSETSERFDLLDENIELGADARFTEWLSAYVTGAGTPDADFLPEWKGTTGGAWRFHHGQGVIPVSLLTFEFRHSAYREGDAQLFATGLQPYLVSRFWLTGQWLRTINLGGQITDGWLARADWAIDDHWTVYGGVAETKESLSPTVFDLGRSIPTHAAFGGVICEIGPAWSVRADFTQEEIDNSTIRRAVHLGCSVRF